MNQGDTWLINTIDTTQLNDIAYHGDTLFQRGEGDHGCIAHEEHLVVGGNLHGADMREHITNRQQSLFTVVLVDDGTQQDIGIHDTFHHHLGLAATDTSHGFCCRFFHRRKMNVLHFCPAFLLSPFNGLAGMVVYGFHSHHLATFTFLQSLTQFTEILDQFHVMYFSANVTLFLRMTK